MDALIFILKSEKLSMQWEATTFTLVDRWLKQQQGWDEEKRREAFNKILEAKVLRLDHMDPLYLATYVVRTPWIVASGLGEQILQRAVMAGCLGSSFNQKIGVGADLIADRASKWRQVMGPA